MHKTPLLLICGSLSLFAAGCGGDDEDSASTTPTTAAESAARGYDETIAAVNDVCKRGNTEIDKLGEKVTGEAGQADADAINDIVEAEDKYIAEFEAIEPDPKLAEAFDAFVTAIKAQQDATAAAAEAAATGEQKAYDAALEGIGEIDKTSDAAARTLGATECAKN